MPIVIGDMARRARAGWAWARFRNLKIHRKLHRGKMLKIVSKRTDQTPIAGMPPARTRLTRHLGARAAILELLDSTRTIRDELAADLAKLAEAEDGLRTAVAADAATLLGQVRQRAQGALDSVSGNGRRDLEAQSAALRHKREVGSAALRELDQEVADFEKQLAALGAETSNIVGDAVLEHARCTIGEAYRETLVSLRTLMGRLEGAERATGGGRYGRLVAEVPSFGVSGHAIDSYLPLGTARGTIPVSAGESDVADAVRAWKQLADSWIEDPQTDPAAILKFGDLCADPRAGVAYAALHAQERRDVDIANLSIGRRPV